MADAILFPAVTRKSGYGYVLHPDHRGGGNRSDSVWAVTPEEEFGCFDLADWHTVQDSKGNLFGVLRGEDAELRRLGTADQLVAKFPFTGPNLAWHGYPLYPVDSRVAENRKGQRLRPEKVVFVTLESSGMVTGPERRRLEKGEL